MEPIKVSVDVKVDFSESAKSFLASLFQSSCKAAPTPIPTSAPAPAAPTPTPTAPAPAPTPAPASSITIEDVRKVLAEKVNSHRSEIKDKLNELGAPSVTKLEQSKYQEMYDFLTSL